MSGIVIFFFTGLTVGEIECVLSFDLDRRGNRFSQLFSFFFFPSNQVTIFPHSFFFFPTSISAADASLHHRERWPHVHQRELVGQCLR